MSVVVFQEESQAVHGFTWPAAAARPDHALASAGPAGSSTGTPLASAACRGFRIPLRETSTPTVGQEVSRTHASLVPRGEKDLEGFDDESVVVELGKA
jgi:hypothetical protein